MRSDNGADLIVDGDFNYPFSALELAEGPAGVAGRGTSGTDAGHMVATDAADIGGESPCFAHLLDEPVD